jgi:hypothetical protein
VVDGKPFLVQVVLGQDLFFLRTRVIEGKGWRSEDFPYGFLGNWVLGKGKGINALFDFDDLLGLFVVKNDILVNGHD